MKDNLGFEQKEGRTCFTLKEGTKFKLGQEEFVLNKDTEVFSLSPLSRDAVVGAIVAGGAGGVNAANFAYVEERENADGKKEKYLVTYGGAANRKEKLMEKGDELPKVSKVDAEQVAEQDIIEDLDNSLAPKPDVSGALVADILESQKGEKSASPAQTTAKPNAAKESKAIPPDNPKKESNVGKHKE